MDKTVGLACNISTGKLDANQAVSGGKYPFFTCAEFPDNIDHFAYDDDVVLVAGNNARGNFHVSRYKGKFNAYQRTYILTAKEGFNIDYIYYALKLELKRLRERAQGSQTKFLTMPILTGIHLRDVTGDEQAEIARVLRAIDKKIELNNRINSELEAMAKTLYDYWFVQFDFPDANGKPYKTSGGKMVYSETLKRKIPEGWEVRPFSEHLTCNAKKLGKKHGYSEIQYLDTANLTKNVVDTLQPLVVSVDKIPSRANMIVSKNDILYSTVRPNQLHYGIITQPVENMVASTGYSVLSHKSDSSINVLFYLHLTNEANTQRLIKISESSKSSYPSISPDDILSIDIALPKDGGAVDKAVGMLNPLFKKISETQRENKELASLRDWLLPMLMNGQVTVKPSTEPQEAQHG
ncbi:restriction endonuclease subunit S [Vibrio cholerae]|uniref:restriction endonuclease subunit S n=1 Tax=Vibrio sp. JPW-9-11-11 TaxID=1416532 RepID=UPI001594499A|nr:restriction endonuclease subunit S [Vibrio sp. JPW-9-11-11]NVD05827.1 restriction endonuclease subunit S [Vibrio sp. JPW-9-11-11]